MTKTNDFSRVPSGLPYPGNPMTQITTRLIAVLPSISQRSTERTMTNTTMRCNHDHITRRQATPQSEKPLS